jgi:hypothetical protein
VLQALGGEPCQCLRLRDFWHGRGDAQLASQYPSLGRGDPRVGATTTAPIPRAAAYQRMLASRRLVRARQTIAPVMIPVELSDIWAAMDQVRRRRRDHPFEGRRYTPTIEERLEAAVRPSIEKAMREVLPHIRDTAPISVGVWKDVPDEPRVLQGSLTTRGGFVAMSLPINWLNRVGLRGLAFVDGFFVLDVDQPAPATDLRATIVRWERQFGGHSNPVAKPARIRRLAGAWELFAA